MTLAQLRQQKADAIARAKSIHALGTESTPLTDAQNAEIDAELAKAAALDADIARAQALADHDRTAPAVAATVISMPGAGAAASAGHNNAEDRPWESFGHFLQAVRRTAVNGGRITDPRLLAAALGGNEGVPSEGGFIVEPEYSSGILQRTYEVGQVTSRCQTTPMASNRLVMNGLDEDSRLPGTRFGGIQVFRIGEAALYTASQPKFRQIELNTNKLIGLFYGTEEILADTGALAAWVNKNFPLAFGFQLDDEAINGTGAGQMLGILNANCKATIVVPKESGQATQTIVTNNILKMWKRMWAPSRANAVWFINQDIEDQLYALTLGSGTAVILLYTPPGVNGNKYGMLMGRPVIPIEQASTLGTQGDIILADMEQYIIGEREGIRADSSIHVQFLTGQDTFRWMLRNDGQPIPKNPLTPYKGTNTLSPFVVLQAR